MYAHPCYWRLPAQLLAPSLMEQVTHVVSADPVSHYYKCHAVCCGSASLHFLLVCVLG